MPEENVAPSITPADAVQSTVRKEAIRQPKAEFKKFTASLLTPTKRSNAAVTARKTNNMTYQSIDFGPKLRNDRESEAVL